MFMEKEDHFVKFTLSSNSLDKLTTINKQSYDNESKLKDAWRNISWEIEGPERTLAEHNDDSDDNDIQLAIGATDTNNRDVPESTQALSEEYHQLTQATQYAFTQVDRSNSHTESMNSISNITDFIYESLERNNGKLDINAIENITDSELSSIVNDLGKKISHKGIYNLCHSICAMQIQISERIISYVCRDVLLAAIISVEEPSRLLNAAITECVGKFPEDIENSVFIPALNSQPKEITTILTMTTSLNTQQKLSYISDLSTQVKDLELWHIHVLQNLLVPNLDEGTKGKLFNLLRQKSYDFCKDKNYGKLILSLLKTNPPTTLQQIYFFEEIVSVHDTLFKKLIDKILKTMSFA